jgi:hypothetical protein
MRSRRMRVPALLAALAVAAGAAISRAQEVPADLTLARMAGGLIGGGEPALTPAERAALDASGNSNRRYDIGDVRLMLYYHPELIPTGTVRTTVSPR